MRYSIVTETYPPEVNGVALTVQGLELGLRERGHEVELVRPRQHSDRDILADTLLLRLGVVLPLQIAGLLMPVRFVGWQKLLAGLSIIALSAILLVGTQWAVGDTLWLSVVGPHTCYYKNEELIG